MRIKPELSKIPRAFFDAEEKPDLEYVLSEERSHHLSHVLRVSVNDTCLLINPTSGTYFESKVLSLGKKITLVKTGEEILPELDKRPRLTLVVALCKGDKNERITDWATELGVSEIIFFQAERSVVKVKDHKEQEKKQERLLTIAEAATLQCGRTIIPKISVCNSVSEVLKRGFDFGESRLVCSLQANAQDPKKALPTSLQSLTLAVGPEGDFTNSEETLLVNTGFKPITLGPQVLRSELAVVSAITAIWHFTH